MTRTKSTYLAVIAVLLSPMVANATLISGPIAGTVVDFSQFAGCVVFGAPGCGASSTPDVGGLVGESIEYSGSAGSSLYNGSFGLADNGIWGSGRNGFVGNNSGTDSMTFTFLAGPVASVSAFVNYAVLGGVPDGGTPILEVLNASMVVLETYDISALASISTGGSNNGAFRGISRGVDDIYAVRWSGAFSVLDDLTFARVPARVPEPTTLSLLCAGLIGFGLLRRRRRVV